MQQQSDGVINDLTAELQRATARITTAEKKSATATAELTSAQAAHSTALHELQVKLPYQVLNSFVKQWLIHLHQVI